MFKTSVFLSLFGSGGMECLRLFLLKYASFSHCHIWMNKYLQKEKIKPFWYLLWGVLSSFIYVCPFFSVKELPNINWWFSSLQSNFTSYVRVSSSFSVVASMDEITFNSPENHIDRFPNFFYVNCLWMFYYVYCNSCFFKNNNRAFHCNCSSMASCCRKFFLWLAETRKSLNTLRCINVLDLVLKICSDIIEGNGK